MPDFPLPHPIRLHFAGEGEGVREIAGLLSVVIEVGEADVFRLGVGEGNRGAGGFGEGEEVFADFAEGLAIGADGDGDGFRGAEVEERFIFHADTPRPPKKDNVPLWRGRVGAAGGRSR